MELAVEGLAQIVEYVCERTLYVYLGLTSFKERILAIFITQTGHPHD